MPWPAVVSEGVEFDQFIGRVDGVGLALDCDLAPPELLAGSSCNVGRRAPGPLAD